jgi:hypothetical protein
LIAKSLSRISALSIQNSYLEPTSSNPNTIGLWVAIGLGAIGLMGTYKFWTDPNAMGADEREDDQETDKHTSDL